MLPKIGVLALYLPILAKIDEDIIMSLDHSVSVQNGLKFGVIEEETLILIVNDDQQIATLIELNFFIAEREKKPFYHFNRAINNLININHVQLDTKRAFLIGDNIHFIYRTNIFHRFSNLEEVLLYEFVSRGL